MVVEVTRGIMALLLIHQKRIIEVYPLISPVIRIEWLSLAPERRRRKVLFLNLWRVRDLVILIQDTWHIHLQSYLHTNIIDLLTPVQPLLCSLLRTLINKMQMHSAVCSPREHCIRTSPILSPPVLD